MHRYASQTAYDLMLPNKIPLLNIQLEMPENSYPSWNSSGTKSNLTRHRLLHLTPIHTSKALQPRQHRTGISLYTLR